MQYPGAIAVTLGGCHSYGAVIAPSVSTGVSIEATGTQPEVEHALAKSESVISDRKKAIFRLSSDKRAILCVRFIWFGL
jgi:hypothetical protein